jgi:surface polysaccharide O-acyltransferase-like enzyme
MEFEDLKKIWDTQNNEPMYAINETALHRRIHQHKNKTGWLAHINEIGMMFIATVTGGFLLIDAIRDQESAYSYVGGLAFLVIGVFVFFSRRTRKRNENRFDQSMLAELDQAIKNAGYLVTFARTFVWWFLLPAAIFSFPNLALNNASWEKYLLILGAFLLSYLVVTWELRRVHLPRKRKLESLRDKLTGGREFF